MNIYFIIAFAIIMLVAIGWFRKIWYLQVNAVASIVTIIGVLGTFLGIAIGLYQFDTGNIEASVPKLLEGLKIAFVTSILGIAGSIALKWLALNKRRQQKKTDGGNTVDDSTELLRNILAVEQEVGKETREILRSIEKSLTGEGDSTVLTQLQKLRTAFSDKQDDLIRAFNEFADQMAENNTNAWIAVIDTNQGISDTLRNQSAQLETMIENTTQQLQTLSNDFSTVVQETIDDSHASMDRQREHLNDFSNMVRESIDNSHADMVRQREALQTFTGRIEDVIRRTHQGMESTLAETNQRLENTLEAQSGQLNAETQRIFHENGERLSRQIRDFDAALQQELTRALESLGSQLTSLSTRFVEDYSPLTEQLRNVVQIASSLPQTSQYQQRRR